MTKQREQSALVSQFNDGSRKAYQQGNQVIVPLKFDDKGDPITGKTFNPAKHLRRLSLDDLRFLKAWRDHGWDTETACKITQTGPEKAKDLIRRLQVFKDEDDRIKSLADIPTPPWIAAKHVENVFEGNLDDSQRDSLKELAKISGAYKPTTSVNVQVSLEKPAWSPEQEAKLREVFDTIAEPNSHAA